MTAGHVPTANLTTFYGNSTPGTTADPAAIDAAIADIVQTIGDNFDYVTGLLSTGNLSRVATSTELTVYVNASTGNDASADGSLSKPYKTIQAAVNSLPIIIRHRVTIQLADGTYNEGSKFTNPYEDASTPRECRVLVDDKVILGRDMLVIKGNSATPSNVVVDCGTLTRGVYFANASGVVLEGVQIKISGAAIALYAHRGTILRGKNINIVGDNIAGSWGVLGESKCLVELDGTVTITNVERGIGCLDIYFGFIGTALTITSALASSFGVKSNNGSRFNFWGQTLTINTGTYCIEVYGDSFVDIGASTRATLTTLTYAVWAYENAHFKATKTTFDGGSRGIFGQNAYIHVTTASDFKNYTSYPIDAKSCDIHLDDVDFVGGIDNILAVDCKLTVKNGCSFTVPTGENFNLWGCDLEIYNTSLTVTAAKRGIFARSSRIYEGGGNTISGGFQGVRLEQNSVYETKSTAASTIQNATGHGIYAIRGSQAYYQTSRTTFSGNAANVGADAATFAVITAF